jgi:hypothetical protein
MASRTSPNNRLQDYFSTKRISKKRYFLLSIEGRSKLTRHKPNTNFHLLVFVVDERRFAADSDSGTLAESGIAAAVAADRKVEDWSNMIEVWASGCHRILVVVDL